MTSQDRSERLVATLVAVGIHVLLIVLLIRVSASRRTLSHVPDDAPVMDDDFLSDARPVSGTAVQQAPRQHFVRCNYTLSPGAKEASRTDGPIPKPGRLGCRTTLSLTQPVAAADIEIRYDQQGVVVEIKGDAQFQGSETEAVVTGWQLARPREGYRWLDNPVYLISIRQPSNRQAL